jgi:5,10-methylenetetrahydromethanopterin reductase
MEQHEVWIHAFPFAGTAIDTARRAEAAGFDGMLFADSQNLVGDPYVELGLAARAGHRLPQSVAH